MTTGLNRFDHLTLRVGDLDVARRWYTRILGYRRVDGPSDRVCLSHDGAAIDLVLIAGGAGVESFALGVADGNAFELYEKQLSDRGVEYDRTDGQGRLGVEALLRTRMPERGVIFEVALGSAGRPTGVTQKRWDGSSPFPTDMDHINLIAGQVRRSSEFLRDRLGLALTDVIPGPDDWALTFLRARQEHHDVGFVGNPDSRLTLHHFALWMDGFEHERMFADHAAAHGVPLEFGPGRHGGPSNNLFVYLFDPFGNRVELCADMGLIPDGQETVFYTPEEIPRVINRWIPGYAPETFLTVGS